MKRFLGISLVCLSAMFVVGCDNGAEGPAEETGQSQQEKEMVEAYGKAQQQAPAGQTP